MGPFQHEECYDSVTPKLITMYVSLPAKKVFKCLYQKCFLSQHPVIKLIL